MKKSLNHIYPESVALLDNSSLISKYFNDISYFKIEKDLDIYVYNGSIAKEVLLKGTYIRYDSKHIKNLLLKKDTIVGVGCMQLYNPKYNSYNSTTIIYYNNVVFFSDMKLTDFEILKTIFVDNTKQFLRKLKLSDLINI